MMDPVNIHQAKTQLSQLLQVVEQGEQGEEVVIARGDARLDPAQRRLRRPVG
jgi:antitoxin (DNA-binding transcriptional repressor) of toxin-antitoxin stability system